MTIWYILCSFGTFFSGFGIMHQKNLATLFLAANISSEKYEFFRGKSGNYVQLKT
jgi:hypothetical protein